jgi:hypothetical protein
MWDWEHLHNHWAAERAQKFKNFGFLSLDFFFFFDQVGQEHM